jgi:hypothetical protein
VTGAKTDEPRCHRSRAAGVSMGDSEPREWT